LPRPKGIGKAINTDTAGYEKRFPDSFLIFQLGLAQNEVGIKEKFWIPNPETTSLYCRFDQNYSDTNLPQRKGI
jgi:hypothetical protein